MYIKIKNESHHPLPAYATPGASGLDLRAYTSSLITLASHGGRALISTGLYIELPEGFEAQVRPRSGLASRHGITVLNTPGTIDTDYRGEIKVLLINLGNDSFSIEDGDRIAQLVVAPYQKISWQLANILTGTSRGDGGYGSTGKQ